MSKVNELCGDANLHLRSASLQVVHSFGCCGKLAAETSCNTSHPTRTDKPHLSESVLFVVFFFCFGKNTGNLSLKKI